MTMDLKGKKVIAIGERDGVPGPAIARCAVEAGAEVVMEMTHCFV
jgi:betaine reductase